MKRKIYQKLLKWKEENILMPLMIIGARQVGKTYIINEFCKNEFKKYLYINLLEQELKKANIFGHLQKEKINFQCSATKIKMV